MNWKRLFWIYFVVSVFHLFVYVLFTCIWRDMEFSMFNLYLLTFIACVVGIVAVVKEEDVPEGCIVVYNHLRLEPGDKMSITDYEYPNRVTKNYHVRKYDSVSKKVWLLEY